MLVWCVIWALAAAGLAWLSRGVDWTGVRAAIAACDLRWVFAAFCANLLGLPFWALAWRALIPGAGQAGGPGFTRLFECQAVILAAIQTLSVLGGGLVAVFMLRRRAGLSGGAVASILTLDQVLTGLVKLLLIGAAVVFAPAPEAMRAAGLAVFAVVAAFCAAALGLSLSHGHARAFAARRGGVFGRALSVAADTAGNLTIARAPGRFGAALGLYLARRSMEGVAAMCVQAACGAPPSWQAALLVIAALSITTVIPGPPGNVGFYEAAVSFAYIQCGYAPELAIAMALLQHVAFLAAAALPGYVVLIARRPWAAPA